MPSDVEPILSAEAIAIAELLQAGEHLAGVLVLLTKDMRTAEDVKRLIGRELRHYQAAAARYTKCSGPPPVRLDSRSQQLLEFLYTAGGPQPRKAIQRALGTTCGQTLQLLRRLQCRETAGPNGRKVWLPPASESFPASPAAASA